MAWFYPFIRGAVDGSSNVQCTTAPPRTRRLRGRSSRPCLLLSTARRARSTVASSFAWMEHTSRGKHRWGISICCGAQWGGGCASQRSEVYRSARMPSLRVWKESEMIRDGMGSVESGSPGEAPADGVRHRRGGRSVSPRRVSLDMWTNRAGNDANA